MKISNLRIKGLEQTEKVKDQLNDAYFDLKRSFQVGQAERGETTSNEIVLGKDEILELIFEDGTRWFSNSDTLADIFPGTAIPSRENISGYEIPDGISAESSDRTILNKVMLKVLNVFTRKATDVGVKKLAEILENRQLEDNKGLFSLSPDLKLREFIPDGQDKPYLLLIHGTASSIEGSFHHLKGTPLMKLITDTYGDRVLAFQRNTLTENPIENTRDLVKKLPKKCRLHLITTSSGGLVGELLSRFCNQDEIVKGFTAAELLILKKGYPHEYDVSILPAIEAIKKELVSSRIVIEKFIRIGCPAGGTTLASKRLDHFFNITINLLGLGTGLSSNPIYSAFKGLIASVIDSKNKADILPGLEVLNPESPFIKVLNCASDPANPDGTMLIKNSLVIIAGSTIPALKITALPAIAAKLFYQHQNDLVVDTQSMSMGTHRSGRVQKFVLEEPDINHFKYIENTTTNDLIRQALEAKWGEKLPGFIEEQIAISLENERNSLLKLDGGKLFRDDVTGKKPIVLILPGIMGSNLSKNDTLLWINYLKFINGGLEEIKSNDIRATSLVASSYKLLTESLLESYDVVTFPFDWRLDLRESAGKLKDKIEELMKYNQPIKIIGHSMGGVLVRDFIVTYPDTWHNLNKSSGFRLIFLGVPLKGSFRIPAVLLGMDGVIKKLAMIDLVHSKKEIVGIFSGFKGILGLLPFTTEENLDFSKPETWQSMGKSIEDPDWPLPDKNVLDWFAEYRDKMKVGIKDEDYVNAVYIAGRDRSTPCNYKLEEKGDGYELSFLSTAEGDHSVTWESGIPAKMIENNTVYYVDVTHGSLANEPELFNGIKEILVSGYTNLFSKSRPTIRGEEKLFVSPEYRDFDLSLAGVEKTILGLAPKTTLPVNEPPIRISISKGDLLFARFPVIAGHFMNDGILSAEEIINEYLAGILKIRHRLGIYPGSVGSSEVFLTCQSGFKGAIIVGLGSPDDLTASELSETIEQGVVNYLLQIRNNNLSMQTLKKETETNGISSLLIGSGYAGLTIENSIKAIIQGVYNANSKIRNLKLENTPVIEHLEFVELFEDKALSSLFSITKIEKEEINSFKIIKEGKGIRTLPRHMKRIPLETSEGWWNRISVFMEEGDNNVIRNLNYRTSTDSSREEMQPLFTTPALLEGIIQDISTNNQWTSERAKTIFELLIPNDFKDRLKRHGNITWVLDKYTASYPWELLQDGVGDTKPICIMSGMIRQLSTDHYPRTIKTVAKNNALIVADPDLKGFINQLPGALKEGQLVLDILKEHGITITKSFKENHMNIIEKMFSDDYKIIHLSGHGSFDPKLPENSGMVIGRNLYLSTREIKQMSNVPELVFVNCCHLGKTDGIAEEFYQQRYKLAANIGTQLIENGVRCVIAAGWAVNDDAACDFANTFYTRMFEGCTFGDATRDARKAVYEKYGYTTNTWGAYQCYGDPFYRFKNIKSSPKTEPKPYLIEQQAEYDLINLLNELSIGMLPASDYLTKLNSISENIEKSDLNSSGIIENQALIYLALGEYERACEKFSTLFNREDASFSFSVAEKYFNAKTKQIAVEYQKGLKQKRKCLKDIEQVIQNLETLIGLSPTSQRQNILGSSYKRQALMSEKSNKLKIYSKAANAYYLGYKNYLMNAGLSGSDTNPDIWYSLTNWLSIENVLVRSGIHFWNTDLDKDNKAIGYLLPTIEEAFRKLDEASSYLSGNTTITNYWYMLAGFNIKLCKYFLQYSDSTDKMIAENIINEIGKLWKIAGSIFDKKAEIEQLVFLSDALSVVDNGDTTLLRADIEKLVDRLGKMI
jgi:hypothetical protein